MTDIASVPLGKGISPTKGTTRLDSTVTSQPNPFPYRVIICGTVIEIRRYQFPPKKNKSARKKLKIKSLTGARTEEYKKRRANEAKNKIRRLVHCNFTSNSRLITLTFRNTIKFDVKNLEDCYKEFELFIRRLRNRYPDLKYIGVPEFQDKNNRGAVHFHLITNIPYIKKEDLADIWGHGFVQVNQIKLAYKVAHYLAKYLTKYAFDERFKNKRKFYTSLNLSKPIEIEGEKATLLAERLLSSNLIPTIQNTYFSHFHGRIEFAEFSKELSKPVVLSKT